MAASSGSLTDGSSIIGRNLPMDLSSRDSRGPKEAPGRSCQNWFWIVQMRPKRPLGLVNRDRRPHMCDRDLHRPLHLLEGATFDLTHPLARDTEFGRKLMQGDRVVAELACLEDAPLALVEHRERFAERLLAVYGLLALGESRFLVGTLVDQPVLPLAGIGILAHLRVERDVAAEPAVH